MNRYFSTVHPTSSVILSFMYMKVLPRTALLNIDETKDLFVKSESQARLRKHLGQNKSHHLHILVPFAFFDVYGIKAFVQFERFVFENSICGFCAICVSLFRIDVHFNLPTAFNSSLNPLVVPSLHFIRHSLIPCFRISVIPGISRSNVS